MLNRDQPSPSHQHQKPWLDARSTANLPACIMPQVGARACIGSLCSSWCLLGVKTLKNRDKRLYSPVLLATTARCLPTAWSLTQPADHTHLARYTRHIACRDDHSYHSVTVRLAPPDLLAAACITPLACSLDSPSRLHLAHPAHCPCMTAMLTCSVPINPGHTLPSPPHITRPPPHP